MEIKFRTGDKVFSMLYGWGEVINERLFSHNRYRMVVEYAIDNGNNLTSTMREYDHNGSSTDTTMGACKLPELYKSIEDYIETFTAFVSYKPENKLDKKKPTYSDPDYGTNMLAQFENIYFTMIKPKPVYHGRMGDSLEEVKWILEARKEPAYKSHWVMFSETNKAAIIAHYESMEVMIADLTTIANKWSEEL